MSGIKILSQSNITTTKIWPSGILFKQLHTYIHTYIHNMHSLLAYVQWLWARTSDLSLQMTGRNITHLRNLIASNVMTQ